MSTRIQAAADDLGFDSAEDLVAMLEVHGLSIATAEERAVLDACAAEPLDFTLRELVRNSGWTWVRSVARAELARREVKR